MSGAEITTEITVLPAGAEPDDADVHLWSVRVQWRGSDRYAVMRMGRCLGKDGEWDYENIPSERADEWKAEHRFPLDIALDKAREAVDLTIVNGKTWAGVLAWRESLQ